MYTTFHASVGWVLSCSHSISGGRNHQYTFTHSHSHSLQTQLLLTQVGKKQSPNRFRPTSAYPPYIPLTHPKHERDLQSAVTSHRFSRLGTMSIQQTSDEQAVNKTTPSTRRTRVPMASLASPIQTRHQRIGGRRRIRTLWCMVCRHGPAIVRVDIASYGPSTDVSRIHQDLSKRGAEKNPVCWGWFAARYPQIGRLAV